MSIVSCLSDDDCKKYRIPGLVCYEGKCGQMVKESKLSPVGIALIVIGGLLLLMLVGYGIRRYVKRSARPSTLSRSTRR